MNQPDSEHRLHTLLQLIQRLYAETEGLAEGDGDLQSWYNRGYANGMIQVCDELGYRERVRALVRPDSPGLIAGQEFLPWGKAYRHGFEKGAGEIRAALAGIDEQ